MNDKEKRPQAPIRESVVIFASVVGCYFYLSLFSFSPEEAEVNLGGWLGWNLAYGSLLMFGKSAYLIIALFIYALWLYISIWQNYRKGHFISSLIGLLLLVFSTCGLETLRVYGASDLLPNERAGGVVGFGVAKSLYDVLGFHGATLILLGAWFSSFSLFGMFSWVGLTDSLGNAIHIVTSKSFNFFKKIFVEVESNKPVPVAKVQKSTSKSAPKKVVKEPELVTKTGVSVVTPKAETQTASSSTSTPPAPSNQQYAAPSSDILAAAVSNVKSMTDEELQELAKMIEVKLAEFGVEAHVEEILPGPVVTRFEIQPATGVKGSQVVNLVRDLSRALSVSSIRVLETIPNKTTMGLEVPNSDRQIVNLKELISSPEYQTSKSLLALALGKDIAGNVFIANLDDMPHLLVAGTTGSGKSVQINSMILSILFRATPDEVRLILIDPKVVELAPFDDLPHLLAPVISDMEQVPAALHWCVNEMERRYQLMAKLGVRNLQGLNDAIAKGANKDPDTEEPLSKLPLIVVVVDELADLMAVAGKKVEQLISRLAQKARAAGIHLILATQRPSVDVITGLIKANVPSRIAFQVSSRIDSRTILDQSGAETLLGKGDMLYLPVGLPHPIRVHGTFVSDDDVRNITNEIKQKGIQTEKIDFSFTGGLTMAGKQVASENSDPLLNEAIEVIQNSNRVSISLVQRHLRIGYNRAARIVEEMEAAGLVTPMDASGNRKLLAKVDNSE